MTSADISSLDLNDNVVSTRFFVSRQKWDTERPWWKVLFLDGIKGGDENCNRTLGIGSPWGILWIVLNPLIRQKPCADCRALYY